MKDFYYYKPSGEIVEWHTGPEELMSWERKQGLTLGVAEAGSVSITSYVLNDELAERPVMPVTIVGLSLKGVRKGAKVIIEDVSYDVTDAGDIELEFAHPGTYEVRVIDWPYLNWSAQVEN
jgi:hypothetical protein